MARYQIERWATEHNCPRTGRIFEIPLGSYIVPRVAFAMALAGGLQWLNSELFWNYKPETLTPEFREEAKRIGNVAHRFNAPPVFLNPFTHRIPGMFTGPEDVKRSMEEREGGGASK